jgi:hypothetical protein
MAVVSRTVATTAKARIAEEMARFLRTQTKQTILVQQKEVCWCVVLQEGDGRYEAPWMAALATAWMAGVDSAGRNPSVAWHSGATVLASCEEVAGLLDAAFACLADGGQPKPPKPNG